MTKYFFIFAVAMLAFVGEPAYAAVVGIVGVLFELPKLRQRPSRTGYGAHKSDE